MSWTVSLFFPLKKFKNRPNICWHEQEGSKLIWKDWCGGQRCHNKEAEGQSGVWVTEYKLTLLCSFYFYFGNMIMAIFSPHLGWNMFLHSFFFSYTTSFFAIIFYIVASFSLMFYTGFCSIWVFSLTWVWATFFNETSPWSLKVFQKLTTCLKWTN